MNAFSSSKELLNEERKGPWVINRDIPRLITPPLVQGVPSSVIASIGGNDRVIAVSKEMLNEEDLKGGGTLRI